MKINHIRPGELLPNQFNSNRVSPEMMEKLTASLKRHGWVKPVIARRIEEGVEILGGQHRVEAAMELGHETVPVLILEEVDETRAREIGLIDNARYGSDDAVGLAEILADIGGVESAAEFLPLSSEDIAALSTQVSDDDIDDLLGEEGDDSRPEPPAEKPRKTHQVMRFKVPLEDAEAVRTVVEDVMREHGFTEEDALTNAGDALVHIIRHWGEAPE